MILLKVVMIVVAVVVGGVGDECGCHRGKYLSENQKNVYKRCVLDMMIAVRVILMTDSGGGGDSSKALGANCYVQ